MLGLYIKHKCVYFCHYILGPKEGSVYNKDQKITVRVFSLDDLRSGVIGYQHNRKGNIGLDVVLLQASDGFHLITFLFDIEVREKVHHMFFVNTFIKNPYTISTIHLF